MDCAPDGVQNRGKRRDAGKLGQKIRHSREGEKESFCLGFFCVIGNPIFCSGSFASAVSSSLLIPLGENCVESTPTK